MSKLFVFLRAVNVGGHTVTMAALRGHFEALGYSNVSTFIASGNVIFDADETDATTLERQIEAKLHEQLGYPVATFLRTAGELAAIASYALFDAAELQTDGHTLYVVFLHAALDECAREKVLALRSPLDDFHVHGREVYWLSRGRISESPVFLRGLLDKATRVPGTSRNMNTVRRLVAKHCAGAA